MIVHFLRLLTFDCCRNGRCCAFAHWSTRGERDSHVWAGFSSLRRQRQQPLQVAGAALLADGLIQLIEQFGVGVLAR